MGIKFRCPNGHKLNVKSFLAGKRGVCPDCQATFRIPEEPGGSDVLALALPSLKGGNGAAAAVAERPRSKIQGPARGSRSASAEPDAPAAVEEPVLTTTAVVTAAAPAASVPSAAPVTAMATAIPVG